MSLTGYYPHQSHFGYASYPAIPVYFQLPVFHKIINLIFRAMGMTMLQGSSVGSFRFKASTAFRIAFGEGTGTAHCSSSALAFAFPIQPPMSPVINAHDSESSECHSSDIVSFWHEHSSNRGFNCKRGIWCLVLRFKKPTSVCN